MQSIALMNAHVQPTEDLLHLARSQFIDAFAAAEGSVCDWLRKLGIEQPGLLGQRIEALRKVEASPRYSKSQREVVHQYLQMLTQLNTIRCSVAHSTLRVVRVDGVAHACFINPMTCGVFGSTALLLTGAQLEAAKQELVRIAKQLSPGASVTPPSSPPRPWRGGAGGP